MYPSNPQKMASRRTECKSANASSHLSWFVVNSFFFFLISLFFLKKMLLCVDGSSSCSGCGGQVKGQWADLRDAITCANCRNSLHWYCAYAIKNSAVCGRCFKAVASMLSPKTAVAPPVAAHSRLDNSSLDKSLLSIVYQGVVFSVGLGLGVAHQSSCPE